jgi:glycosyltransferase involved in cell wall biosynthesis
MNKYKNSNILKNKTACFALLTRNCRDELEQNLSRIERIIPFFKETYTVVVENGSTDGTKEFLRTWKLNRSNNFFVISDGIDDKVSHMSRIEKLSYCRNLYLTFIFESSWWKSADYLIVIDSDIQSFSENGLIKALENAPPDWSALFANGRFFFDVFGKKFLGRYYDLLAFVPQRESGLYNGRTELTYREMLICSDYLSSKTLKKKRYLNCLSAFGGIGIYKANAIQDSYYKTYFNKNNSVFREVCEHIAFNLSVLRHGKNYIAFDMLVLYEKNFRSVLSKFFPMRTKINICDFFMHKKFPE